jgi:hypothetical protein
MSSTIAAASTTGATAAAGVRARSRFFFVMSGVIFAFVLVGFARTLYLRVFFDVPPVPTRLLVHGAALTTWFAWLFVQASMAGTGRIETHRRLGVAGLALGPAVVLGGLLATLGIASRIAENGLDLSADASVLGIGVTGMSLARFAAQVMWLNFGGLTAFALLLSAAMLLRGRPQAHKRLMLLASIAVLGPALARIARWPGFGGEQGPFVPLVLLLLIAAIAIHDLVTTRRLHPATSIGGLALIVILVGASVFGGSEAGLALVRELL